MSIPGTSPRDHTLTTTTTDTFTTTTTAATTGTVTAAATEIPPLQRSSPPKDDSPTRRSKKTLPPPSPRTPRAIPVPALRLRSTSSCAEITPPTNKTVPLSQSHPLPATSTAAPQARVTTASVTKSGQTSNNDALTVQSHSEPSFQIVSKRMPVSTLKKIETEHQVQKLADLIIDDLVDDSISASKLKVLGRVDSAFYIDRLPAQFKAFAIGVDGATIPSGKLLQRYFAQEFRDNLGWGGAKSLYASFNFKDTARSGSGSGIAVGEGDPGIKQAEKERMHGVAEVIVRMLIGYPPTVDSSPLPKKLFQFLITCDQRLHAKLLKPGPKNSFSTEQIRTGRLALLTNLIATRLLQPMLSSLASKYPSQSEMWFLGELMKGLVAGVEQLSVAFFNKSFATSPLALQQQAMEKLTQERIASRIRQLQSKPTVRHARTRSADTEPVSPRTLRTIEQAKSFRKLQKVGEMASDLEAQDWSALDEANREITENLAVSQAQGGLQPFDAGDINALVQELIGQRGDFDDFVLTPRRAQPLEDSEEPEAPGPMQMAVTPASLTTTTINTVTTTTTTTGTNTVRAGTVAAPSVQGTGNVPTPGAQGS